jgi:hypothetical protein
MAMMSLRRISPGAFYELYVSRVLVTRISDVLASTESMVEC